MLDILYFASLREQLSTEKEQLEPVQGVSNVAALKALFISRGGIWKETFAGDIPLLVSINQQMATDDSAIQDGDEIAFFPPVTGG